MATPIEKIMQAITPANYYQNDPIDPKEVNKLQNGLDDAWNLDEDKQWFMDKKTGQPTQSPMAKPSLLQGIFNPDVARQVNDTNLNYGMALPNAQLKYRQDMVPVINDFNAQPPEYQAILGNPARQHAWFGSGPTTPGSVNQAGEDVGFANQGGIDNSVNNRLATLATSTQDQLNLGTKLREAARLRTPTLEAGNEFNQAGLWGKELGHMGDIQSDKFALDTTKTGNQLQLAQGETPTIPSINEAKLFNARTAAELAKLGWEYGPTTARVKAAADLAKAERDVPAYPPGTGNISTSGIVTPSTWMTDAQRQMYAITGQLPPSAVETKTLSSGTKVMVPKVNQAYDPRNPTASLPPPSMQQGEFHGTGGSWSNEPVDHDEVKAIVQQAKEEHEKNGNSPRYQKLIEQLQQVHTQHSRTLENSGVLGVAGGAFKDKIKAINDSLSAPFPDSGGGNRPETLDEVWNEPMAPTGPFNVSPHDIKRSINAYLFGDPSQQ